MICYNHISATYNKSIGLAKMLQKNPDEFFGQPNNIKIY